MQVEVFVLFIHWSIQVPSVGRSKQRVKEWNSQIKQAEQGHKREFSKDYTENKIQRP